MDSSDEDRPIRKNERKRTNALLDDNTDDTADEMKAMDSSDEDRPVRKRRKRKKIPGNRKNNHNPKGQLKKS